MRNEIFVDGDPTVFAIMADAGGVDCGHLRNQCIAARTMRAEEPPAKELKKSLFEAQRSKR